MATELSALPTPDVLESVDFDDILAQIVTNFQERDPEYLDTIESDPAYILMEAMAFAINIVMERVNSAAIAVLVTHATGSDLDHLGALFSVFRREDETDAVLRVRITERLEAIVPGSSAWYRGYAIEVEVTEVAGADNVVDSVETPVTSNVKDARVRLTPDPNYDSTAAISATNLPDIPGSLDLLIQSEVWTHPTTSVVTQVIPSANMLQAVRDYIDAVDSMEADADLQVAAEDRRFINDTVNVIAVTPVAYIFCAKVRIAEGLDEVEVLRTLQETAHAFALDRERIATRVPLSQFYSVLSTDQVTEITLMHPMTDLEPESDQVPVAFLEQPLEVSDYRAFTNANTFAAETQPSWSIGEHTSKWWLLFRVEEDSVDHVFLKHLVNARRLAVFEPDDDDATIPKVLPLYTYRVAGGLEEVGTTHYQVELTSDSPAITGLTDNDSYFLRLLDSVEIIV